MPRRNRTGWPCNRSGTHDRPPVWCTPGTEVDRRALPRFQSRHAVAVSLSHGYVSIGYNREGNDITGGATSGKTYGGRLLLFRGYFRPIFPSVHAPLAFFGRFNLYVSTRGKALPRPSLPMMLLPGARYDSRLPWLPSETTNVMGFNAELPDYLLKERGSYADPLNTPSANLLLRIRGFGGYRGWGLTGVARHGRCVFLVRLQGEQLMETWMNSSSRSNWEVIRDSREEMAAPRHGSPRVIP